jgi:hypothetical protein
MLQTCVGTLMLICLTLKATSFRIINPGNPSRFLVGESRFAGYMRLKKISTRRQGSDRFFPMTGIVGAFDSKINHGYPKLTLLLERICKRSLCKVSMVSSRDSVSVWNSLNKNTGLCHLKHFVPDNIRHNPRTSLGSSDNDSDLAISNLIPSQSICDKDHRSPKMVESESTVKLPGCLHGAAGEEVSTRVPFLGGWAETFPDMVERGAGMGRSGAAHCRIPFLFGTQRRPAALAILAPPESTSLYTRIPFLSGSVRPPRSAVHSWGSPACDRLSIVDPTLQEQAHSAAEVDQESVSNGDTTGSTVLHATRSFAASSGKLSPSAVEAQAEHVAYRARRAAAAALDSLRLAAVERLKAGNVDWGAPAEAHDQSRATCVFDLEAECCQDMRAENMNRTVPNPTCALKANLVHNARYINNTNIACSSSEKRHDVCFGGNMARMSRWVRTRELGITSLKYIYTKLYLVQ